MLDHSFASNLYLTTMQACEATTKAQFELAFAQLSLNLLIIIYLNCIKGTVYQQISYLLYHYTLFYHRLPVLYSASTN